MTYELRKLEASYEAPSGRVSTFIYEDMQSSVEHRSSEFEFPQLDGTYVQQNGLKGRRYNVAAIFNGRDHDLQAKLFEELISEKGPGVFTHPYDGQINAVALGQSFRKTDFVRTANETVFTVTFKETLLDLYPSATDSPVDRALSALDSFIDTVSDVYDIAIDAYNTLDKALAAGRLNTALTRVLDLVNLSSTLDDTIKIRFNSFVNSVLSVGGGLFDTYGAAGRINTSIYALSPSDASVFSDASRSVVSDVGDETPELQVTDSIASVCIAATASSLLGGKYRSREEAQEAADILEQAYEDYITWKQSAFIDNTTSYAELYEAVKLCLSALYSESFQLQRERVFATEVAHTPVDLCYQLYGSTSELDNFISLNRFNGNQLFHIPRGSNVVYLA